MAVLCDLCGDEVYIRVKGAEQLQFLWPPPLVWWVLNEATVDSALLDALEQFEDQATNRLLLSVLN